MPAHAMLPPYLTDAALDDLVARALAEDVGPGDVTTRATISEGTRATAAFLAKEDGVLAGLYVAARVFAAVDPAVRVHWQAADGDAVTRGTVFGTVEGAARSLLTAERLALRLVYHESTTSWSMTRLEAPAPARSPVTSATLATQLPQRTKAAPGMDR